MLRCSDFTYGIGTQYLQQAVPISNESASTMDQPLILLGRAQCQSIANLALELLDGGTGGCAWESQRLWDAHGR
jgi:hypothetical protein